MTDDLGGEPDPGREVRELHEAIAAWFRGEADDLSRFADALAPEFRLISPDGTVSDREGVVAGVRDSRGVHADADPPFRIDVQNLTRRMRAGDHHLLTYEEHQRIDGEWVARVSTALLRETPERDTGVEWVHLQETWLPEE